MLVFNIGDNGALWELITYIVGFQGYRYHSLFMYQHTSFGTLFCLSQELMRDMKSSPRSGRKAEPASADAAKSTAPPPTTPKPFTARKRMLNFQKRDWSHPLDSRSCRWQKAPLSHDYHSPNTFHLFSTHIIQFLLWHNYFNQSYERIKIVDLCTFTACTWSRSNCREAPSSSYERILE